jgi:hypothetical protein
MVRGLFSRLSIKSIAAETVRSSLYLFNPDMVMASSTQNYRSLDLERFVDQEIDGISQWLRAGGDQYLIRLRHKQHRPRS